MTFPKTERGIVVEMQIGGVWTDITTDIRTRESIAITRGQTGESGRTEPSSMGMQINNVAGKYSRKNPLGPYYGQFGRNTQLRVGIAGQAMRTTTGTDGATTPDGTAVSVTGDIDIRVDLDPTAPDTWATDNDLVAKWGAAGQRSYAFILFASGKLSLRWSADGTAARNVVASIAVPAPTTDRRAVRVTMDVDNGAGSHIVTFYTAPTMDGPWTQLGATGTATGGGTTSIFDSTTALRVGAATAGSADSWGSSMSADVYKAELRNGIGGTVVANPDFTAQPDGTTVFTDTASAGGRTWTLFGSASIGLGTSIYYPRGLGEIAELPPRWDNTGDDAWVPISVNGISRRTGAGAESLQSGLYTYLTSFPLLDYWPLNDGDNATLGANADGTGTADPFRKSATAKFGADLGLLGTGLQLVDSDTVYGGVGSGSPHTTHTMDFVYQTTLLGTLSAVMELYNAQSQWQLLLRHDATNGDMQLWETHNTGGLTGTTLLGDTVNIYYAAFVGMHHLRLTTVENGSDVDYTVYLDGVVIISGTHTGVSLGGIRLVQFNFTPISEGSSFTIAHVATWDDSFPAPPIATVVQAFQSWRAEPAGRRFERLLAEAGYPFVSTGDLDATVAMGPQFTDYLAAQLEEVQATDFGLIYEPTDRLALGYRTLESMYTQTPVTLDYAAGHLAPPFEPSDDDQLTRNDVFAQNREGASHRLTKLTGPLSTADPPAGVGRYKDEVQVNAASDAMLPQIAGWLLGRGTTDELRYPRVAINLASDGVAGNPVLVTALLGLRMGDRIVITNADTLNIYDDISLIVVGLQEILNDFEHSMTLVCVPEAPYAVLVMDDPESRIDPGDTLTLAAGINTVATSISIASSEALCSTAAGDYPCSIMIGGEEMTLTAVTGGASPQTGTVTRSVNGVVKSQPSGASIQLKRPGLVAL